MCSLSDHQIVLLGFDIICQLSQPQDRVIQRVRVGVSGIKVNHTMNVERHVQVSSARLLVGETVLVLTLNSSLDSLVTVVNVVQGTVDTVTGVDDEEVNGQLFSVVWVSGSDLESDGQHVVLFQVFVETLLSVWSQQHRVGVSNSKHEEPEQVEIHGLVVGMDSETNKSCLIWPGVCTTLDVEGKIMLERIGK